MAALVLASFGGLALADPVTYDLVAETGSNGGTPTGFITWDSATVTSNADLTLANAVDWNFALRQLMWEKGVDDVFGDSPSLSGVFGVEDLLPAAGHDYRVGDPTPTDWALILRTEGWWMTSGLSPEFGENGGGWKLALRATGGQPIPEPGTLVLSGLVVIGAVWMRRRRRS
jgi:hypothetical protein